MEQAQEYAPKWMYHKKLGGVICKSAEEEKKLGADWFDTPEVVENKGDEMLKATPIEKILGEKPEPKVEATEEPKPKKKVEKKTEEKEDLLSLDE